MLIPVPIRLLLAALSAVALAACAEITGTGDPNVAATVNGSDVPVSAVEERFEQAKAQPQVAQQLEADPEGAYASEIQAQILSQLVVSELLQQWADELGIEATDDDVAQERADLIEQLGGQEAFDQAVSESGLSEADVTMQIRQRVLQDKIAEEVAVEADVSDADIQAFYDENAETRFGERATARHILLEDRRTANRIMQRLRDGEDFAELAAEESTDPGSASSGGELPPFGRGQMVPPFEEAVFAAEEGDLLGPVRSEFGFHVIEVIELTPASELDEVRDEIRDELAETKEGEALQAQLGERTKAAEVSVNPRFGTWNPETGQVEPTKPLGDTSESPQPLPSPGGGGTEMPLPTEIPTS